MIVDSADLKENICNKRWLFFTTSSGVCLMLIPVIFLFVDPILVAVDHYIRLGNGTYLHELMLSKVEGPRIYMSLFNYTNAHEYMVGNDKKIKLEEIGPFVFQEYRINQGLVIDGETKRMVYTPRVWAEFIPEESIADPKDVCVTMPSIPMLQSADLMSKNFFLRNFFNMVSSSIRSKAIVNVTAHEYLWGYPEPLIQLLNTAVPGLFYYNSSGIMERIYDVGANYKIELGTKDEEKCSVQRVTKIRKVGSNDIIDSVQNFTNAYEGAAFPPGMTRDTPVSIYRHGVCKVFGLTLTGSKMTEYGSEAFTYDIANETLNDHELCLNNGKWCPDGIMSIAPCFFNLPFAISRSHFLYADPRIMERFEGLKPDPKLHSTEAVIDPILGVTLSSTVSIQINLALRDISYNTETKPFKDTVLPICNARLKHPKLPPLAITVFKVLYTYGPYIRLAITAACLLAGLTLLAYSVRTWYWHRIARKQTVLYKMKTEDYYLDSYFPLIK